jgi:glycosyltransferase involved in cell wall biosynthesis
MPKLSVILITLNEEENIDRCLGSVSWADEIVVVDSFSRDRTLELARKYTDRLFQNRFEGSTRQMLYGIEHASGDWILLIDGDEEVSPELAAEIRETLVHPGAFAGFDLLRKPWAFGNWIEHGGWFPDYQFRLFRKDAFSVNHEEVHGGFEPRGPRGRLQGVVFHYTYPTVYSYLARMNDYTSLQVSNILRSRPDRTVRWYNILFSPLSHFLRMYVSNKGYKDGFQGFALALLDAVYSMMLYLKLWEYRYRREQGGELPPITNLELNRIKHIS